MELLGTLCGDVLEYNKWVEESIQSKNMQLADIEAQGVSHFPELKEHVQSYVGQVKAAEISVKTLKQEVIQLNNSSTKHDDELRMILKSFSVFRYSLQKSIQTVTGNVEKVEDSTLVGTATVTSLPEKMILENKIEELDMDRIADCLRIDGLESRINTGADEMRVDEVIILSLQDLKAHMVATNCEGVGFGSFFYPYNILTRIQQILKGKNTFA